MLFSDKTLGRICGVHGEVIQYQRLWRPLELLAKIPQNQLPEGRSIQSFASTELILGVRVESVPVSSIQDRIIVHSFDHVKDTEFFYRQVVLDDKTEWRLEPHIPPRVQESDYLSVENPEMVYQYCDCSGERILYPTNMKRKHIGDVESGYIPFKCPDCSDNTANSEVKTGGLEWLKTQTGDSPNPDDPKRCAITEKLFNGLSVGLSEVSQTLPLSDPAIVRRFCCAVEEEIHQLFLEKPKEYKARVFTVSFNLSDSKNSSLRRRILEGQFTPRDLATATSEEMASDDLQQKRKALRNKHFQTQVLKRKEDMETDEEAKRIKPDQHPPPPSVIESEPMMLVAEPPKADQHPPPPSVIESEPMILVVEPPRAAPVEPVVESAATEERTESAPIVGKDQRVTEFVEYADKLKAQLSQIESVHLREHSHLIVDYYLRHLHR